MKVKIGNVIYDASERPIMLILTDEDKSNIANMGGGATRYCAFPDEMDTGTVERWMMSEDTNDAECLALVIGDDTQKIREL